MDTNNIVVFDANKPAGPAKWSQYTAWSLIVFAAVLVFIPLSRVQAQNYQVIAPTIITPNQNEIVTELQSLITGVAINNTLVDVYINGIYNGRAKVKNGPHGVASWAYRAFRPLPKGDHRVAAVARSPDETQRSRESLSVAFKLESPFPAPTLLGLDLEPQTSFSKPHLEALAKNSSIVDIYLDGRLDGTIQVADDQSGTASFKYQPSVNLEFGWHSFAAIAKDTRGKKSKLSQSLVFEVRQTTSAATSHAPQVNQGTEATPMRVPAPTLLEPITGSVLTQTKPLLSGVAPSQHTVEIFIDGALNGKIKAKQHASGVYSFGYRPFLRLEPGFHQVTGRSIDQNGEKSSQSKGLGFIIKPSDHLLVVSPAGISLTRLFSAPGAVVATSTASQTIPPLPGNQTPTTTPTSTTPDTTPSPPGPTSGSSGTSGTIDNATATSQTPTLPVPPSSGTSDRPVAGSGQEPGAIVVIGDRSTSSTATENKRGNTALVVILAVAAIIIIGLISWYTSKEEKEVKPQPTVTPPPAPAETEQPVWTEEPNEISPPNYSEEPNQEEDDLPPPPPPPALGI